MINSTITSENPPPSNTGEVAKESLWRFLRPLGKSSEKGKTGMAAVKKEQLPEHATSLSKQQQQNIKGGK